MRSFATELRTAITIIPGPFRGHLGAIVQRQVVLPVICCEGLTKKGRLRYGSWSV